MFRTSVVIAAIGGLFVVSSSFANFTLFVQPSAQAATLPGRTAYDVFARNDVDPADGVNLQIVTFTFTGSNNTKAFFESFDNGDGTFGVDPFNFGAGTTGTNIVNRNVSNLRIGTRTAAQHTFIQYPGDPDSGLTMDEATSGVLTFQAEYAVPANEAFPSATSPGARFARLVVNSNGLFTVAGSFGGEVGAKSAASVMGGVIVDDFNRPVISPPNHTINVAFGQSMSSSAEFSTRVNISDADGDAIIVALGQLPSTVSEVTIAHESGSAYAITGRVAYSAIGTDVVIPFSASSGIYTGDYATLGSVRLHVTPEPATLGALGAASVFFRRRRLS